MPLAKRNLVACDVYYWNWLCCILASSENASDSTSVGELHKTTEPVSSRKRESTDSENDGPSRKKTASGLCLKFITNNVI